MTKTALVTGDLGFIGRHVRARLEKDGWEVDGCDIKRDSVYAHERDCRRAFAGASDDFRFDLVVHCAAVVGGRMKIDGAPLEVATDLAIDSDFAQFVARTKPRRSIYFSSSAAYPIGLQTGWRAYPNGPPLRLTENMIRLAEPKQPDAIYGWVKLTGERLAALLGDVTVFRPFSGYGSDQDLDYPFPSFIERAVRRADPFHIWGDGTQIRDWIHVDDIVESIIASLELPPITVNLCTGFGTSMLDLARICADTVGYRPSEITLRKEMPTGVHSRIGDPAYMLAAGLPAPKISILDGVARAVYTASHEAF